MALMASVKSVHIRSYSDPYFPAFWTEYGELRSRSTYSVQIRENMDQNISEYGKFSRSMLDVVKT